MNNGNGHKKNGKKLTPKQAKFVEAIKKNPTIPIQKAAAIAGYSKAPQSANENLKKPNVRNALKQYLQALERAGVNDDKSARVISEAMDAKTTKLVKVVGGEDGEREMITEEDHTARLKANDQYLKVKRLVGYDDEEDDLKDNPVQILIVNYADTNSGKGIPPVTSSPNGSEGPVKISDDYLAQTGKKNNPSGQ